MKYSGDGHALRALIELSRRHLPAFPEGISLIVPVPLYPKRLRERGFNQALSLARGLFPKGPVDPFLLEKVKDTKPQAGLSKKERKDNVKDAFQARRKGSLGKVMLVDDVLTTGATASICARVLKYAGAEKVYVLTVARALFC